MFMPCTPSEGRTTFTFLGLCLGLLKLGWPATGLPCAELLLAWLLLTPFATPYCANGLALGGKLAVAGGAACLIFNALCMRFFEGDTGMAPLPMVKTGCVLAGCLSGPEGRGPISADTDSMPAVGLKLASPVNVLSLARLA